MTTSAKRVILSAVAGLILVGGAVLNQQLPALGAGGLLHPARRHVTKAPPSSCEEATLSGVQVTLRGWKCRASGTRLGTLIYLHGIADNRMSGVAAIQRFGKLGFDVLAYDSRAHGESDGDACTYGYFEKQDLARVLDSALEGPVVLFGVSLGAAVALQHAAESTVAIERAPFFFTSNAIARAFELVKQHGRFDVDAVSPVTAAAKITVPVLLIHGDADVDTTPDHSRRVFAVLRGPKKLIIVPGAAHNQSLPSEVLDEINRWLDTIVSQPSR